MSTVAVPLQVQTAASQVAFTNSGPVLSLGLTIQIPINELIEALLAYQEHYQRSAPGGLSGKEQGAGAGASPLGEPKAGGGAMGGLQREPPGGAGPAGLPGHPSQPPPTPPSAPVHAPQPHSQSPPGGGGGAGGGTGGQAGREDVPGAPGLAPPRQQAAGQAQYIMTSWETDYTQIHRKTGDEYFKKSKWNPEKGFVPPNYKKGSQNPLQIKDFAISADGESLAGKQDNANDSRDGAVRGGLGEGDGPEEDGNYPPGLSPLVGRGNGQNTSDQSDALAARNSLGSALSDGDDTKDDNNEKDCKQQ